MFTVEEIKIYKSLDLIAKISCTNIEFLEDIKAIRILDSDYNMGYIYNIKAWTINDTLLIVEI